MRSGLLPSTLSRVLATAVASSAILAAAPSGAVAGTPPAATIWALPANGNSLVRFQADAPGTITDSVVVTGLQSGEKLAGIDFRPRTGQLFGVGVVSGATDTLRVYTVDTRTGAATLVPGSSPITGVTSGSDYGMGFNPTVDRMRVVNSGDENLRVNPNNGARQDSPTNDQNLSYPGTADVITGIAYDRSFDTGLAVANRTTNYAIGVNNDTLATIGGINQSPSPNAGAVNPVGAGLGHDPTGNAGFDIDLDGTGYAGMTVGGVNKLYTINLGTGAATHVGNIANGNLGVNSLAVVPPNVVAAATDSAGPSRVRVLEASTGAELFNVVPYGGRRARGVRVALGDVDLDSAAELVTAPGPGVAPRIALFDDGGAPIDDFLAYGSGFRGGVYVASGDVNGDGNKDIITAAGPGDNPGMQVRVFSGATLALLAEFDAFAPSFNKGVTVASADFDRDGDYEIVAGAGRGSTVRVFDGTGNPFVSASLPSFDNDFDAHPAGYKGGVYVSAGDVSGDGVVDILAGAGRGEVPKVAAFSGVDGTELGRITAFGKRQRTGVHVAAADVDLDGRHDIIASLGARDHEARAFDGISFEQKKSFTGLTGNRGVAVAGVRR